LPLVANWLAVDFVALLRHHDQPVKSDFRFHHSLRVRFAETDLQGIVFNGNYLTYYDVAWTEYFRGIGLEYKDFASLGADTVLARTTMEFKSPARFDESLEIHTRVSKIGTTSLTFEFEIYPEGEDRLVGSATALYVCVDPTTLRPVRVPDSLRLRVSEFEGRDLSRGPTDCSRPQSC
jgi:acyl-CoA thioester hydrolase